MKGIFDILRRIAPVLGSLVGLVFLLAALGKLLSFDAFMDAFPVVPWLSDRERVMAALLIVAGEICLGFELVRDPRSGLFAGWAGAVLLVFTAYSIVRLFPVGDALFGAAKGCGCIFLKTDELDLNERHFAVGRNIALSLMAAAHLVGTRGIGDTGASSA